DVGDLPYALVGELRDVHQAVGARHDLDEGAEVDHAPHGAAVDLAYLGLGRESADAVDGLLDRVAVRGGHQDRAIVFDVDRRARLLDDSTNRLAAGADQVADAIGLDAQRDNAGGIGGQLGARRSDRLIHDPEDVHAGGARLLEGLLHHRARHAADLDVHLSGGDAGAGPGALEVHVAEVVLVPEDVGEDAALAPFLDEPHRHAGPRRLDRHTGLHE